VSGESGRKRVGIVGGGVAGLMAAWELSRMGFDVELFEAAGELGGLASSFDFDGINVERFYHFICRTDRALIETCARLGIQEKLAWRRTRTGYYHGGRLHAFSNSLDLLRFPSLSFLEKARFGLHVLHSRRFTRWPVLEDMPATDWLVRALGRRGYDVIWDPLLRVKFDDLHEGISAAWMWHRIHRVAASRRSVFHGEQFGRLEGGSDTLIRALESGARANGARIHLRTRINGLWIEGERCRGLNLAPTTANGAMPATVAIPGPGTAGAVAGPGAPPALDGPSEKPGETGARRVPFDYVICALPLPVFRDFIPPGPSKYMERIGEIQFIGVVCMILRLKERFTRNFWLNVNDPRIAFNGIIEYSNLCGTEIFGGRSIVYIPFYTSSDRPRYRFSDEQLFAEYMAALRIIRPDFSEASVESYRVFRAAHAQPVCHVGFSRSVPPYETPWEGCYLVESTQLYPADRVISGTLRLAQDVTLRILDREGMAEASGIRWREAHEIPA